MCRYWFTDRKMIETRLGCMWSGAKTNMYGTGKSKVNAVTSAVAAAMSCMVEFVDLTTKRGPCRDVLAATDILSVTHAAVPALIVRCFATSLKLDGHAVMVMSASEETVTAMQVYVGSTMGIDIVVSTDSALTMHNTLLRYSGWNNTVLTYSRTIVDLLSSTPASGHVHVNAVTDIRTLSDEEVVINTTAEGLPLWDPRANTVRVASVVTGLDLGVRAWTRTC